MNSKYLKQTILLLFGLVLLTTFGCNKKLDTTVSSAEASTNM